MIISYSIGTRACCALCILFAIKNIAITPRLIEEKTHCKKNTLSKAFNEICHYFDKFIFLKDLF